MGNIKVRPRRKQKNIKETKQRLSQSVVHQTFEYPKDLPFLFFYSRTSDKMMKPEAKDLSCQLQQGFTEASVQTEYRTT